MLKNLDFLVILALGVMLLGLGSGTFFFPDLMNRYGLSTETTHAKSTIMAIIGGAEIGLGCFFLCGRFIGASSSTLLWLALFLFLGIVTARFYGIWVYSPELPNIVYRELVAELLIIAFVVVGLKFAIRN